MASTIPSPSQISNLPPPSSHRLPTVSVAQALSDLESSWSRCISTGLRELDAALQGREIGVLEGGNAGGGVSRGKVTEIWGPPGVGKTALGMQLAASSLHAGEGVIWVDGSHPISGHRFSQILSSFEPTTSSPSRPEPTSVAALMENLTHFSTPTLAHLIALLSYQTTNYEDSNTSLIIIDSFSTLISNAFPRTVGSASIPSKAGASNYTSRKFPMLQHVVNLLQKLAATRNLAVVVLSQCVTKMRPGAGAVLMPAVSTAAWEQGLGSRVVLFRDWGWDDEDGNTITDVRLAEVVKAEGVPVAQGRRRLLGFSICNTGLRHLALPTGRPNREAPRLEHAADPASAPAVPRKRKMSAAELEIPDSEGEDDEDYGWAEEDEEDMPPMPPQWQGSEDILVPGQGELESEGGEDEEEEEEEEAENGLDAKEGKEIPGPDARDATVERGLGVEVGDSEDEGL